MSVCLYVYVPVCYQIIIQFSNHWLIQFKPNRSHSRWFRIPYIAIELFEISVSISKVMYKYMISPKIYSNTIILFIVGQLSGNRWIFQTSLKVFWSGNPVWSYEHLTVHINQGFHTEIFFILKTTGTPKVLSTYLWTTKFDHPYHQFVAGLCS